MASSTQDTSATAAQADTGKRGMWWGYPLEFWQSVILWTMWGGFVLTAVGAALAVISSFLAYQVSDVTQADADRRIAVAGAAASAANEASAKANAEAARANKAAAEANERAQLEELERLKLEARYAPRRLRVDQIAPIVARLSPFAGKTVKLVSYVSDVEGVVLATGLAEVFQRAGLKIDEGRMSLQAFGSIAFGVYVGGRDERLRNTLLAALIVSPVKASFAEPMPHNLTSETADAIVFVAAKPVE